MDAVEALVASIGQHTSKKAYRYLEAAVRQGLIVLKRGETFEHDITVKVYEPVSKKLDISVGTVSRAVSRALSDLWNPKKHKRLEEIFGHAVTEYPTPRDLIYALSNFLQNREEKRAARNSRNRTGAIPLALPYQTYYPFRTKKTSPELGDYYSYDIAVYGDFFRGEVVFIRDVTTDTALIVRMIDTFNRCNLSILHLKEAILDMLP